MAWAENLIKGGLAAAGGVALGALKYWRDSSVSEKEFRLKLETMEEKLKELKAESESGESETKKDLDETVRELRAVVMTVAKMQTEQDVVNRTMTVTLQSLLKRIEEVDHRVNDLVQNRWLLEEVHRMLKDMEKGKC